MAEEKEIELTIFEISNPDNRNIYIVATKSRLNTRVQLIKKQYAEYLEGDKSRKQDKEHMMKFIQDNGGIDKVVFRRLHLITVQQDGNTDNLVQGIVDVQTKKGMIVCNVIDKISKQERSKNYYEANKEKHLAKVKAKYQETKEVVLAKRKEQYANKVKEYIHCECCNKEVLTEYYDKHCKCVSHIKLFDPDF